MASIILLKTEIERWKQAFLVAEKEHDDARVETSLREAELREARFLLDCAHKTIVALRTKLQSQENKETV